MCCRLPDCSWIMLMYASFCGIISLFVFCFVTLPDIQHVNPYQEVTTMNINMTQIPHRCCEQTGCECTEAAPEFPMCGAAMKALNQTACSNGFYCCDTVCQTCQHCAWDYYYGPCDGSFSTPSDFEVQGLDGGTQNATLLAMPAHEDPECQKRKRVCTDYNCDCKCVKNVTQQLCYSACGTCNDMYAEYKIVTPIEKVYSLALHCGLNDTTCVNDWVTRWAKGTNTTGWYDQDTQVVTFTEPSPYEWNMGGYVSSIFFLVLGGVLVVIALWVSYDSDVRC